MKSINRREALLTLSSATSAMLLGGVTKAAEQTTPRTRMGIVTYAFGIHQKNQWAGRHQGLTPPLSLLEEAHDLGRPVFRLRFAPRTLLKQSNYAAARNLTG